MSQMSELFKQKIAKKKDKIYVIMCEFNNNAISYINWTTDYNTACKLVVNYSISIFFENYIIKKDTLDILSTYLPYSYKYLALQKEFNSFQKRFVIKCFDQNCYGIKHVLRNCRTQQIRNVSVKDYSNFYKHYLSKYKFEEEFSGYILDVLSNYS